MDPNLFVGEVYRRMAARYPGNRPKPTWSEIEQLPLVQESARHYAPFLPRDKNARILDIGFGGGWFLAACLKLGYTNLAGAEFGLQHKEYIRGWAPEKIALYEIHDDIGEFLGERKEHFDFIHLSHVIEHIPKYSLLWIVDALYYSLRPGGSVLMRTPNMEGPCANSSFYVTLAHEYGFAGSNLRSLLQICGFDDIRLIEFPAEASSVKQWLGKLLRWPIIQWNAFQHRLFGVNYGNQFGSELIVIGTRGDWPPYFDRRFK